MSRQNNNSPVPQEADQGVIQNIDILNNEANGGGDNNNNEVANQETVSHAFSAE